MYSYHEFEHFFIRYKLGGVLSGISIEQFCISNNVSYNLFEKCHKDMRRKIMPVPVLGAPPTDVGSVETPAPSVNSNPIVEAPILPNTVLRILVDINMSNSVHIS